MGRPAHRPLSSEVNMEKIKWIKLGVNILDDEKIIAIEGMPDGNALCWMWVKLLALAGKQGMGGEITLTDEVPYTESQLAARFRMPLTTVQFGLKVFQNYGMIRIIDDVIYTNNWAKYQSIEDTEKHELEKEKDRERKRVVSEMKKAIAPPDPPEEEVFARLPLISGDTHIITKDDVRKYSELYPAIDVRQEIRSMIGWCDANPKNRKTRTGVRRFINSWLSRSQDRAPRKVTMNPQVESPSLTARGLENWD